MGEEEEPISDTTVEGEPDKAFLPPWRMAMRPGHNNSMTLCIIGLSDKDKAQLCVVTPAMTNKTKYTPSDVISHVMGKIKDRAAFMMTTPIQECRNLDELRRVARQERSLLLDA